MYHSGRFGFSAFTFQVEYFARGIDEAETPISFLEISTSPNTRHILSYPFLFFPPQLITYFRTINYTIMFRRFFDAECYQRAQLYIHTLRRSEMPALFARQLQEFASRYLILDVRRTHILEDTFNQLWGLDRKQLLHSTLR